MHEKYYKHFNYQGYEVEICWELVHDNFTYYIKWNGTIIYVKQRFDEPDDAEANARSVIDFMIENPNWKWKENL